MKKQKKDLTDAEAQAIIDSFVGFDPSARISAKQKEKHSNGKSDFDMEQENQIQRVTSEKIEKKDSTEKKGNKYDSLFINKKSDMIARKGRNIKIRDEHHRRVRQIVQVIGSDKINISRYIDNVLSHHLDKHKDDIIELYSKFQKPTF